MHPVLFQLRLGDHTVALHAYGLLITAGFVVGVLAAGRAARRAGIDADTITGLCFWLVMAALVGSRVAYVVATPSEFAHGGWPRIFAVWRGGLVFYGGFLAAAATAVWYARRHGLRFFAVADLLAPPLALGHAIGRVGCFLAGCCFGRPSSGPFGVRFPDGAIAFQDMVSRGTLAQAADATPPLHPTQLYEAAVELVLFVALTRFAPRKRFDGQVVSLWLLAYAPARFAIEALRGDPVRGFVGPLSIAQALSIAFVALGLAGYLALRRLSDGRQPG